MPLILYDCATAPNPRRARMLLAEKGLSWTTVAVDLRRREQLTEAFRRINPLCTVPVLELDDGTRLTDNAGIARYLEAAYPEPNLCGYSPMEQAQIASWHWRAEHEGLLAVAETLRNQSPAMVDRAITGPVNYPQIPALVERGQARTRQFFQALDEQLAQHAFVAGERFTLADITALVAIDFARVIRLQPDSSAHPHLLRWYEVVSTRPSARV